MVKWKLKVWDWFLPIPLTPSDMKSPCHKEWLQLFTPDSLNFNKASSKRDSCGVSHREVHCFWFAGKWVCSHPCNFSPSHSGRSRIIFLHWHWRMASAKHSESEVLLHWQPLWPLLGGYQAVAANPALGHVPLPDKIPASQLSLDLTIVNKVRQWRAGFQKPCF